MKVQIDFRSFDGRGFAGFLRDSVKKTGTAEVIIDIDAMLNCCVDEKEITFKQLFSESVVHEILHGIEELFDKSFDEDRVEKAIEAVRENICS